jgi:hypothetical protein
MVQPYSSPVIYGIINKTLKSFLEFLKKDGINKSLLRRNIALLITLLIRGDFWWPYAGPVFK